MESMRWRPSTTYTFREQLAEEPGDYVEVGAIRPNGS
jgi:hypothetical protein